MCGKGIISDFLLDLGFSTWDFGDRYFSWLTIILIIVFDIKSILLLLDNSWFNWNWDWFWSFSFFTFFFLFFLWLWCWNWWSNWLSS
jgi:hypothetical protein